MFWYLQVLKKYAVFSGRARRKEYWMFNLVNSLIAFAMGIVLGFLASIAGDEGTASAVQILTYAYALAVLIPGLAVCVRRLHDTGHSGWWYLIGVVPIVGGILLLVWFVSDSDPGENKYGPNPKEGVDLELPSLGRTLAIVALVLVVGGLLTGGVFYLAGRGVDEARALAPWPRDSVPAEKVASLDLTSLGLQATGERDARSMYGQAFLDGAVIEYAANGQLAALVAALRYSSSRAASAEFDGFEAWAQTNCSRYLSSHLRGLGVIHCDLSGSHDLILFGENWIIDVEAGPVGDVAAAELAGKISAAAAAHWQGLSGGL